MFFCLGVTASGNLASEWGNLQESGQKAPVLGHVPKGAPAPAQTPADHQSPLSPRPRAHLQVRAPTRCRNSVLSFFLLRHRAAATLFFSRRLFLLSSSSSSCNKTEKPRSEPSSGGGWQPLAAPLPPSPVVTSDMVQPLQGTKHVAATASNADVPSVQGPSHRATPEGGHRCCISNTDTGHSSAGAVCHDSVALCYLIQTAHTRLISPMGWKPIIKVLREKSV